MNTISPSLWISPMRIPLVANSSKTSKIAYVHYEARMDLLMTENPLARAFRVAAAARCALLESRRRMPFYCRDRDLEDVFI